MASTDTDTTKSCYSPSTPPSSTSTREPRSGVDGNEIDAVGPVVASGVGGPVEAALLARVEAAEAAVRRIEALHRKTTVEGYPALCIDGDCGHDDMPECPTRPFDVCAYCYGLIEEAGFADLGECWPRDVEWPCSTAAALADPVAPRRYDQCDDTCTVDCGHCKGRGKPVGLPTEPQEQPTTCEHGLTQRHAYHPSGHQSCIPSLCHDYAICPGAPKEKP